MHDRDSKPVTTARAAWAAPRVLRLEAGAAETHPKFAAPEFGSGS